MIGMPIKPRVLALRTIPQVAPDLHRDLRLAPEHQSLGLLTCTSDDALYASLDEATKAAEVDVVYARSFYAGASHASGPLSGEVIGVLAARDPETVASGIAACLRYLDRKAWFYSADEDGRLAFFPHVIPAVGRYLARVAGVDPGTPMAYLIAPPLEATMGLDAALKAAEVTLRTFYAPPSETNFAGGLLTGTIEAVEAAARAFRETVMDLARQPRRLEPSQGLEEVWSRLANRREKPRGDREDAPYRLLENDVGLESKPDGYTHLFDNQSLVPKGHPVIRFRGALDLLQAHVLDAQIAAMDEGMDGLVRDLDDVLEYLRKVMAAEVAGRPMPRPVIAGFDPEELHRMSHQTSRFLNVGWVLPRASMGRTVVKLNLLRASCRQVEIVAHDAFAQGESHLSPEARRELLHGLNRLSNALYVLVCRAVALAEARRRGPAS